MIGKGVLIECIEDPSIQKVTLINRSPIDIKHPKIHEILLKDFQELDTIKKDLGGIDACFHIMGVSAIGLSEESYSKLTYDITAKLADIMYEINPEMTFIYVSGTGTDSSEKGSIMWARVKGRAENHVLKKGFNKALMFRPGAIIPEKGTRSKVRAYRIIYALIRPFFPLMKKSNKITTTTKIGRAMIHSLSEKLEEVYFENPEINLLAEERSSS